MSRSRSCTSNDNGVGSAPPLCSVFCVTLPSILSAASENAAGLPWTASRNRALATATAIESLLLYFLRDHALLAGCPDRRASAKRQSAASFLVVRQDCWCGQPEKDWPSCSDGACCRQLRALSFLVLKISVRPRNLETGIKHSNQAQGQSRSIG